MQAYDQELSDMQEPRISAAAALVAFVFNRPTEVFFFVSRQRVLSRAWCGVESDMSQNGNFKLDLKILVKTCQLRKEL